jgi:creatinine amidohydrolase
MLAEKINGVVAPTVTYGYKSAPLSGGGPLCPGTMDLNGATLTALISDILEELIKDGAGKLLVLNGHFENESFVLEAVDLVSRQHNRVKIVEGNWWDQISEKTVADIFNEVPLPWWALEHAAVTETSLTLLFAPELVKMDRLVEDGVKLVLRYSVYPAPINVIPETGLLATARTSSAAKGKILAEDILEQYAKIATEEFSIGTATKRQAS